MKTLFSIVGMAMIGLASYAQDCPYKFMGISLDVDIELFKKGLNVNPCMTDVNVSKAILMAMKK